MRKSVCHRALRISGVNQTALFIVADLYPSLSVSPNSNRKWTQRRHLHVGSLGPAFRSAYQTSPDYSAGSCIAASLPAAPGTAPWTTLTLDAKVHICREEECRGYQIECPLYCIDGYVLAGVPYVDEAMLDGRFDEVSGDLSLVSVIRDVYHRNFCRGNHVVEDRTGRLSVTGLKQLRRSLV